MLLLDIFLEPLKYNFMQRSLIVAILVGLLCSIVGSFLMVQRLSMLGDAISHSVMPGLAIAFSLEAPMLLGALLAAIMSTIAISWINDQFSIKEDTAIGIVFASFFALGITLITIIQKEHKIDLNHFLFGNILGVTAEDVLNTAIITSIVLFIIILLYKELLFYTFDSLGAATIGLPVKELNFGLMTLVALTTVASMKAVGVVLVLALLIIPTATAYLLVSRLNEIMTIGSALGILSSIIGMYISYFFNIPSGPAIVLVSSSFFCLVILRERINSYIKVYFKDS
uniref:manganese transport system membrane protein n=1 Tax=Porphyridium aerugineum TaxID=2792 RepID=UPI001FCDD750|nr:manganese transport system membrane protein [Porphyridium aerugineum]UNJ17949.1 manganese transport system membrane protein [Porphyridium aerugineum]